MNDSPVSRLLSDTEGERTTKSGFGGRTVSTCTQGPVPFLLTPSTPNARVIPSEPAAMLL